MADLWNKNKWVISMYAGLVFFILASPISFKLVNRLVAKIPGSTVSLANLAGCPTWLGLFIHALLFVVVMRVMMLFQLPGVKKNPL